MNPTGLFLSILGMACDGGDVLWERGSSNFETFSCKKHEIISQQTPPSTSSDLYTALYQLFPVNDYGRTW